MTIYERLLKKTWKEKFSKEEESSPHFVSLYGGIGSNFAFLKETGSVKKERKMTIELIFKIAAVGILVTILGQVLKHSGREEQAFLVSLAGLFIVLSWIIPCISELFTEIYSLFQL